MSYSLNFARFIFTMQAVQDTKLPYYKGSTLRGALGHAFKKLACLTRRGHCRECMFLPRCAYAYVFETPAVTVEEDFNHHFIPHPFIIEPPLDGRHIYTAGDEMEFILLLMGRGLDYLPFFITSFEHAASVGFGAARGAFTLKDVDQLLAGGRKPVWRGGARLKGEPLPEDLTAISSFDDSSEKKPSTKITLELQTPTRLFMNGKPVENVDFTLFLRSVFRRLDLLGRAHGNGPLKLPFRDFLSQAAAVQTLESKLTWCDWSRYSERQKKHVLMGGLTGQITFSGRLRPFLPFLYMAQVVHVGKGTVYGMGKVELP